MIVLDLFTSRCSNLIFLQAPGWFQSLCSVTCRSEYFPCEETKIGVLLYFILLSDLGYFCKLMRSISVEPSLYNRLSVNATDSSHCNYVKAAQHIQGNTITDNAMHFSLGTACFIFHIKLTRIVNC